MSGQNEVSKAGREVSGSEMAIGEFWKEIQGVIEKNSAVSREFLFGKFGRTKTWVRVAELERNGYVKISVISGEVSIVEVRRGEDYIPLEE